MPKPDLSDLQRALDQAGPGSSDFDLHPDIALPAGRVLKPAGVLMAVDVTQDEPQIILTKRAAHLKNHPGQIAFPGGRQDDGDADATDAALREAEEEIGLPRSQVKVIGTLEPHETVTRYSVVSTVGLVAAPFDERPEPGEVSEIFRVPLSHVLDLRNFQTEGRMWQGHRRMYYTVPYGPYYIWGATARILRILAERIAS